MMVQHSPELRNASAAPQPRLSSDSEQGSREEAGCDGIHGMPSEELENCLRSEEERYADEPVGGEVRHEPAAECDGYRRRSRTCAPGWVNRPHRTPRERTRNQAATAVP